MFDMRTYVNTTTYVNIDHPGKMCAAFYRKHEPSAALVKGHRNLYRIVNVHLGRTNDGGLAYGLHALNYFCNENHCTLNACSLRSPYPSCQNVNIYQGDTASSIHCGLCLTELTMDWLNGILPLFKNVEIHDRLGEWILRGITISKRKIDILSSFYCIFRLRNTVLDILISHDEMKTLWKVRDLIFNTMERNEYMWMYNVNRIFILKNSWQK